MSDSMLEDKYRAELFDSEEKREEYLRNILGAEWGKLKPAHSDTSLGLLMLASNTMWVEGVSINTHQATRGFLIAMVAVAQRENTRILKDFSNLQRDARHAQSVIHGLEKMRAEDQKRIDAQAMVINHMQQVENARATKMALRPGTHDSITEQDHAKRTRQRRR